jgi:hypothetical protein
MDIKGQTQNMQDEGGHRRTTRRPLPRNTVCQEIKGCWVNSKALKKGLVTRHRFQVGVREPLSQSGPLLGEQQGFFFSNSGLRTRRL